MPAPNHRTLPTPCERGCGRMCRYVLHTCHVHGAVVQVGARGRAMAWWDPTAQKSGSPPVYLAQPAAVPRLIMIRMS